MKSENENCSVVSDPATPWPYSPWNSLGQNTGVGNLSLLQGIFPTQGSSSGLPHCRQVLYQLSHKGSLKRIVLKMKHSCYGPSSRLKMTEQRVSELQYRSTDITQWERQEKNTWAELKDLWNTIKRLNIYVTRVPETKGKYWCRKKKMWRDKVWEVHNFCARSMYRFKELNKIGLTRRKPHLPCNQIAENQRWKNILKAEILIVGIYPREMKTRLYKNLCRYCC